MINEFLRLGVHVIDVRRVRSQGHDGFFSLHRQDVGIKIAKTGPTVRPTWMPEPRDDFGRRGARVVGLQPT